MRRLLVFLLFSAVLSGLASAQVGVSLDLAYSRSGYSFTKSGLSSYDSSIPVGQSFECSPRIGYRLSDFFECGVDLGIANSVNTYTGSLYDADNSQWVESSKLQRTMMAAHAGGYLRFLIHDFGHFSLHAEVTGGYVMGWGCDRTTEYEAHYGDEVFTRNDLRERQLYAQIVPVFNYSFRNHFSMDVYMNFASVVFTHDILTRYASTSKDKANDVVDSETVTDNLDLGIHTLNTSLITLGFSYSF